MSRGLFRLAVRAVDLYHDRLEADRKARGRAPRWLERLLAAPPEHRLEILKYVPPLASPALGHLLLDRAEASLPAVPADAADLAGLALAIGRRLEKDWKVPSEIEALLGRASCVEGEACRLRGDLAGARWAHRRAFRHLEALPAGGPERADFCRTLARLRRDQGRDDEALALMARALDRFEAAEDRKRARECRLDLAWMHLDDLETEAAVALFEAERAEEARPGEEPSAEAWLLAREGLALAYADSARDAEARAVLAEIAGDALDRGVERLRLKLVEASVLQRLDAPEEAAALLFEALSGYVLAARHHDAIGALLELAMLRAEQGSTDDLQRLRKLVEGLEGVVGENVREAVLQGLELASEHGLAAVERLEALKLFVQRGRHDAGARFVFQVWEPEEEALPGDALPAEPPVEGGEDA